MEVTLYILFVQVILVEPLCHSLCVNAQWNNPINYSPLDMMNKGATSMVTWSVSFSCVFVSIMVFVVIKLHPCCRDSQRRKAILLAAAEVIDKCPIFDYSTVKELRVENGTEECPVCLMEFQDSDTIKMLPRCQHLFHHHCIDQWLPSHMTCPICRQKLTYDVPTNVPMEQEEDDDIEITESEVVIVTQSETETDNVVDMG